VSGRRAREQVGIEVFERFATRPGSGYIASGFALSVIADLVARRQPGAVLEIGSGIGTITTAVLEASDRSGGVVARHVAVEDVAFCVEQLEANLGERRREVEVLERARDLDPAGGAFDLVIVDGGHTDDLLPELRSTFGPDAVAAEVDAWVPLIAPGATVVFENERRDQRERFEAEIGRPFAYERLRPLDGTPGVHLYHLEPGGLVAARSGARTALDAAWHPRLLRSLRRVNRRLGRPPLPVRSAVAPGDAADAAD
jgi:predicted O-methyltransferase YrrM